MAAFKGDVRYQAVCKRCKAPMGDWAMKLPEWDRFCYKCSKKTGLDSYEKPEG